MSSKSKKQEHSSDLSRHYREIGIKAVSSAAAGNSPKRRKRRENENRTKEDTDE